MSASISSTRNRQDSTDRSTTQLGTSVQAGRIDITAREGDITGTGVKLQGRDITLDAQRDIDLIAAANTAQTQSSNSGSSAGLGVTAGVGSQNGISFQVSASRSQGHANGSETHDDNSLVTATHALTLRSGGDTHLLGAQVSAEQIRANIGGDLLIQSLQEQSDYESRQASSGIDMSLCVPPICDGQVVTANVQLGR